MSIPHPRSVISSVPGGCGFSSGKPSWFTRGSIAGICLLGGSALFPQAALAHGIVGKADLPIPVWLFSWAAAIVLVVSFVALSSLWRTPQLQSERLRRAFRLPTRLEPLVNLIGLALFALVIYSGFAGAQEANANFSVTFIYVVFWVGLPLLSALFGDIFRVLSPWRSCARVLHWTGRQIAPKAFAEPLARYPQQLGMWPAVVGLVGFGWLELVYLYRDVPCTLAALSAGYFLLMVAGMTVFGVEEWGSHADGFAAYFNIISRLSPIEYRQGVVYLRRPLSGITGLQIQPGTIALICTIIGTTTFDGLSNGGYWKELAASLVTGLADLGCHQVLAVELVFTFGLLSCIALVAGIYRLGVMGLRTVSTRYSTRNLASGFAHTLVPIGFAYVLAHYFSFIIWQGQAMGYLISDPLGNGANLLGTAGSQINYKIISYAAIWYVQVAALLLGHVGGLVLAHDKALTIYRNVEEAVRSQYWMLAVMVAFTSFGLWLLSAVGT
ncbi:MAG: fenitrothion hydrolase [Solirubrobacteraceae bacterium]